MADFVKQEPCGILVGKVALVTGGASGIGRATARLFAQEGAAVAIADVDEEQGQAVTQGIIGRGGDALFVRCDVSSARDCQHAVGTAVGQWGKLDILFNGAGITKRASVVETTEQEWDRVMAVNVKSVFLLAKYAIPVMTKSGGGTIVNMASGWGLVGGKDAVSYCASKGAVVLLTKAMALDHGAQNIRVNCICPGDTDTPMLRNEAKQLGIPQEQVIMESARRPLQRVGRPEEVAQGVLYLVSDASSFVTGTSLVIDGGGFAGSE